MLSGGGLGPDSSILGVIDVRAAGKDPKQPAGKRRHFRHMQINSRCGGV
jgi:hypothetical protein